MEKFWNRNKAPVVCTISFERYIGKHTAKL